MADLQRRFDCPFASFEDRDREWFRGERGCDGWRIRWCYGEPTLELRVIVRIETSKFRGLARGMRQFHVEMKDGTRMPLRRLMLVRMQERRVQEGDEYHQAQRD